MRSSLIAIMLALAKCQQEQVCQVDWIDTGYSGPDCKEKNPDLVPAQQDLERIIQRTNEMIQNGPFCQNYNESSSTQKFKITCLNSETMKLEPHNYKGEDSECQYPYPVEAAFPSYIAKNGDCVKTMWNSYTRFKISSPTGIYMETTNSWELPSYDKIADTSSKEEEQDRSTTANSCMVADYEQYDDPDCTKESNDKEWDMQRDYFNYLSNTAINSPDCLYPQNNEEYGLKVRGYCQDPSTVTFNFYNQMSEDPNCLRPYPSFIEYENSFTARDGECFRMDNKFYRMKILPNDGRKFEYKSEWDDMRFKQDSAPPGESIAALQRLSRLSPQNFKMEGDGYYMEVNTDTSEGYKQETTMKFDNYFMYGIDYVGEGQDGYKMPPCGPDAEYDLCKEKSMSEEYCCTHITGIGQMFMERSGQTSFYRCMNQKIVDASFSFEIDGIKMSMSCTENGKGSAAAYFTSSAILASIIAMISLASF